MMGLSAWWTSLSEREHWMLGSLAVTLAAVILVQFVLVPLFDWRADQTRILAAVRSDAQLVQSAVEAATFLDKLDQQQTQTSTLPLRQALGAATNALGITITRIQPDGQNGLNVWTEPMPATLYYQWCADLYAQHGVTVTRASLQTEGERGLVRAQTRLEEARAQ